MPAPVSSKRSETADAGGTQLQVHAFGIHMPPRPYMHYHEHRYHEFFYCAEGTGTQYREGRELAMRAGDLFLFPAGVVHMGAGDPGADCLGIVLYLHERAFAESSQGDAEAAAVLRALVAFGRERDARLPLEPASRPRIDAAMRRMAEENRGRRPGYRAALKAAVHEFLVAVARDARVGQVVQPAVERVQPQEQIADVCRYLDVHFRERITVAAMAELAGMSRSHFHSVFKRETGVPLTHYLQTLRVHEAERLLRETARPVLDIALESGFPSLSHFYAVFGRRLGCAPSVYRERLTEV